MRHFFKAALLCAALASAPVMAADLMSPVQDTTLQAEPGKALVVFLRPSALGGLIASSVYDATDTRTEFLGAVRMHRKFAYQAEPGAHRFMVVAENADFLDATLEAGKTYYVLISPRPGMWKARFSLLPIHNDATAKYNLNGKDFQEWMGATTLVSVNDEGRAWFEANKASVESKKAGYLEKWDRMLPEDRARLVLKAEDGVSAQ